VATASTAMESIASSSSAPTTAAAYLSNPSIACSLVGFLTTRELGRLIFQTNKDMTQALLGSKSMNLWSVLCESRWKNSKHVEEIRQYTGLSHKAIFRCFAYSEERQPPRQEQPLTLPLLLPALQYTPEDYVMVIDVRHDDATDDKLLMSFVLPGQEILTLFRHGEAPFLELDEPAFLTTFQDRCEHDSNGERMYGLPNYLPPFQIKIHLWRRGHKYVELLHLTNCVPQAFDFWSIDEEGDDNDIIAVVCGYETTSTEQRAFPPLSDRLEQHLPLLSANDGIEFCTSLLFNVHYSRRRQEQAVRAAANDGEEEESTSTPTTATARIYITSVFITGSSGELSLDQTFREQEGEVEFAHLLEAMDWQDAV